MSPIYIYLLYFVGLTIASLFLHNFFFRRSKKYPLKKANKSAVRFRTQEKPVSGGITFVIILTLAFVLYSIFYKNQMLQSDLILPIGLAGIIAFLMGLADDVFSTSPYFKFLIQILAAIVLINYDLYIKISDYQYINYLISVLWVVGIMNSINMLDNMDAVTTSVSLGIFILLLGQIIFFIPDTDQAVIYALIATIAALFAFLFFNWPPAKMYMGDNGSQFIGILLAVFGIIFVWNANIPAMIDGMYLSNILPVMLVFIIPLTDTTTVSVNRILKGKSPFVGGKDHTTHHLHYLGFSEKNIALIYFVITLLSGAFALYLIYFIEEMNYISYIIFWGYALIVFLLLYLNTRITKYTD